jgi:cytochrome c5
MTSITLGAAHHSLNFRNFMPVLVATAAVAATLLGTSAARAQGDEKNGQQVVAATCASCHESGKDGAPKMGDKAAWAKRSEQGLSSLSKSALTGIRKMPAHGGNLSLSDTEIKRAVAYMVNQSGGNWAEPTIKTKPAPVRSGEQIVKLQCSKCHETGETGAPKIGDKLAWSERLKYGLDATVASAINGHGAMPARGGMPNSSDAELRSAIVYMFSKVGATPK